MQYAQDYDEMLPYQNWNEAENPTAWHKIRPYIKNYDVYKCPSLGTPGADPSVYFHYARGFNYFINAASLGAINKPSETLMAGEKNSYEWCIFPDSFLDNGSFPYNPSDYRVDQRHSDGSNFLFCDGHVKWMKRHLTDPDGVYTGPNSMWDLN